MNIVTLELPESTYDKLQKLAHKEQTDLANIIVRLVEEQFSSTGSGQQDDPVFELIGAYQSERPLIDKIPASEDPDLYLAAEALGKDTEEVHAWEIAPARYKPDVKSGPDEAKD